MASRQANPIVITGIKGRDGSTTDPTAIPAWRAAECLNVDFYRAGLARKRGGSASFTLTFSAGGPFSSGIQTLLSYIPASDFRDAELWAIDGAFLVGRLAGGTTWSAPTLKDAVINSGYANAVSLNGKLYLAYASAVNRLHVWDGSTVRRVGLAAPDAPAVADTGAGAYAATTRYYRARWQRTVSSTAVQWSEAGAVSTFTPSGAGTAARVSRPALKNEGETEWIVEASADNLVWYQLTTLAIATTTYDDSAATTSYSTNDAAPLAGEHEYWGAVGILTTDGNRLIGAASFGSVPNNRVYFSAVLGTTADGWYDEERVPNTTLQTNYVDLDENDGDCITGLSKPFQGGIWAFKTRAVYKLDPTGNPSQPYRVYSMFAQSGIGCVHHKTIVHAIDEMGQPALYWLSEMGPCRVGSSGFQFLGDDIQDVWDTVNLDAVSSSGVRQVGHGIFHAAKKQIWWWIATGGSSTPNKLIVFDTRLGRVEQTGFVRNGWSVYTGNVAGATCSVMFASDVNVSMSAAQKPYLGRSSGTAIYQADRSETDDAGTAFQAYVTLPDRLYSRAKKAQVPTGGAAVVGTVGSHSLRCTLTRDYGAETSTADATMTAEGSQTRKRKVFEDARLDNCDVIGVQVGDSAAVSNGWTIDRVELDVEGREASL